MQPHERVRQQALPSSQHAPPPAVRRQSLIVSSSLDPSPARGRSRYWRSLHRLDRVLDQRWKRESVCVVRRGRGDEEMGGQVSDGSVVRAVGAPNGGPEVVKDCRIEGRASGEGSRAKTRRKNFEKARWTHIPPASEVPPFSCPSSDSHPDNPCLRGIPRASTTRRGW